MSKVKDNYRVDRRTKSQFKKDILRCSKAELDIFLRLCYSVYKLAGDWPDIDSEGTDFNGQFIDIKDVTRKPDFVLQDMEVEITHSRSVCKRFFHEKKRKVNDCIDLKSKSSIVFVNGHDLKTPEYIWLDGKKWNKYTKKSIEKYGELAYHPSTSGNIPKACYRYDIDWFKKEWEILPELDPTILPSSYQEFLDAEKS